MKTIQLPKLYSLQEQIKKSFNSHRFVVANCARRVGKSFLGLDLVITKALDNSYDTAYFSITYKQLTAMFDRACTILAPIATFDRANKRIKLTNSATITFWSLESEGTAESIRGQKYGFVVIDEAAYVKNLKDIFNKVIRPTLIDLRGSALFISTPNGYNDFYTLYREEKRNPYLWKSFTATTYDNPFIDNAELDELRTALPDRTFRIEILAQFLESNRGVFTNVSNLVSKDKLKTSGICVIGVDLARTGDNTVLTVMQGSTVVNITVMQSATFSLQVGKIKALHKEYKPEVIIIESNGLSMPIVEELTTSNLPISPFHTTQESKKVIIENLAVAIEQGELKVQPDLEHTQQLLEELSSYESKKTPLGATTYNAPPGKHDDCVMSLALAYSAVRESDVPLVLFG